MTGVPTEGPEAQAYCLLELLGRLGVGVTTAWKRAPGGGYRPGLDVSSGPGRLSGEVRRSMEALSDAAEAVAWRLAEGKAGVRVTPEGEAWG